MILYDCMLFICKNPMVIFNDKMSKEEKYNSAIDNSLINDDLGYMEVICEKPIPIVFDGQINYAKEVLTGIRIPLIARGVCPEIKGGLNIGKVFKPYYVMGRAGYVSKHLPCILKSMVKPSNLNDYACKHMDQDGTFNTYKNSLNF